MTGGTWPLTYVECRERFRRAATEAGAELEANRIDGVGRHGEDLTIDVAQLGSGRPRRVLLVLSGTHGIEGYAGSAMQRDLLAHLAGRDLPDDVAVIVVHAVNPWGMSWWRRANEHNVDLNRNWGAGTGGVERPDNEAYAEIHELLCPDGEQAPDGDRFVTELTRLSETRGLDWVRAAITAGQVSHPDGLYFAGRELQPSTRRLDAIATDRLVGAEAVLAVDLHTGHGRWGTSTLLSKAPLGGDDDRWIRRTFADTPIETSGAPEAISATKSGQLAPGLLARLGEGRHRSLTFELGTRSETRMIVAERAEHWAHRFDRRNDPVGAAAVWEHRVCSMPDDADWEETALVLGRRVLHRAMDVLPDL
ncbi:MAG: DUF2817 domain-containing protein [Actinomycetota bacterium]